MIRSVARLRYGLTKWRRMGASEGTVAAARLAVAFVYAPLRRAWLAQRPISVSLATVHRALGGEPVAILRGPVRDALPTVVAFERNLELLDDAGRARLLEHAEDVLRHRFDLLGSGPTDLGSSIDWALDFKAGRRWPMLHISQLPIVLDAGADIKVPWELSRFQHLPLLAAASRVTGEQRWLEEIGSQLQSWIVANPVEFGPNWACTMDVAIRAANWIATLVMVATDAGHRPWFDAALSSLLLHGRFIRSHLEWAEARGNHYLSDIVGLLVVAALFGGIPEGRRWARFAAGELTSELAHQVRADGCDHEASIPYHRLVTELFVCGTQAAHALAPRLLGPEHNERIERMLAFVADYTRPDGIAPQVGDADDGRFLPLGDYGNDPRRHGHLFTQARQSPRIGSGHAAYPDGGYWIMRAGELFVLVRCGDVGLGGIGPHAHNDALSFELAVGSQPLVVDPGTYLYTADPAARNRFRSTAYHSTLQLDGAEQNPLSDTTLFEMPDRRLARALSWDPDPSWPSFVGRHDGFAVLESPAIHCRQVQLDVSAATLTITDIVSSAGAHEMLWTLPLAPCTVTLAGSTASATFPSGARLEITVPGTKVWVDDEYISPSYGRQVSAPFLRACRQSQPGDDVTELTLRVTCAPPRSSPFDRHDVPRLR